MQCRHPSLPCCGALVRCASPHAVQRSATRLVFTLGLIRGVRIAQQLGCACSAFPIVLEPVLNCSHRVSNTRRLKRYLKSRDVVVSRWGGPFDNRQPIAITWLAIEADTGCACV